MNLIAAADENFGIGKNNKLPWHISADMKYFRNTTTGKAVIMGRKTLESFPNGKPLPNRENIVLSRSISNIEGVTCLNSVKEIAKYQDTDCFVIGGGEIYKLLLPYVKFSYITRIYAPFDVDTYIPNLDNDTNWTLVKKGEILEENGLKFSFDIYENTNVIKID